MTEKEKKEMESLKKLRKYLNDRGKERLIELLIAREHDLKRQVDEYES